LNNQTLLQEGFTNYFVASAGGLNTDAGAQKVIIIS
jgi:hypothetical protein